MGDFDDVLAMEPGDDWDDWDDYAAGEDPRPLVELAPLQVLLHLPATTVAVHGSLPDVVLATLVDLSTSHAVAVEAPSLVQLSVERSDDVHAVIDVERGTLFEARGTEQLLERLLEELVRIAVRATPGVVHLDAALVELGSGRERWGVLLLGPEPLRRATLAALRGEGAVVVGEQLVELVPGSRTTTALALPTRVGEVWTPLSRCGEVGSHAVVDRIVVLDPSVEADELTPVSAAQLMLAARRDGGLVQLDALDVVAGVAVGACSRRAGSVDDATRACLEPTPRRPPVALGLRSDGAIPPGRRWAMLGTAVLEADEQGTLTSLPPGTTVPPLPEGRADDGIGLLGRGRAGDGAAGSAEAVDATLVDVCARVVAVGATPIVLGAAVLAHDGPFGPSVIDVPAAELLVPRERLPELVELLVDAGHEATLDPAADSVSGPAVRLRAPGSGVAVLLYDRLAAGPFGELVDHDEFHARAVPFRVGGHWLRSLHPEDRFVLACVRLAMAAEASPALLRQVELSAPRAAVLLASSLEASERWGATRSTLAAVRKAAAAGAGLSPWLLDRARRGEGPPVPGAPTRRERRRRRGRRT